VRRNQDGHFIHANIDLDIIITEEVSTNPLSVCISICMHVCLLCVWCAPCLMLVQAYDLQYLQCCVEAAAFLMHVTMFDCGATEPAIVWLKDYERG